MFRNVLTCIIVAGALSACGDGRGTSFSSQRAQTAAPAYIPVTPGAVPVTPQTVNGLPAQPAPAVLTQPIAITPGAQPVDANGAPLPAGYTPSIPAAGETTPQPAVATASVPAPTPIPTAAPVRRYARGEIYTACRGAGRKEATDQRCGCVQWVANQTLSPAQQVRGAGYFSDQQGLQDTRQSDGAANERFWAAWKEFGQQAGGQCQAA